MKRLRLLLALAVAAFPAASLGATRVSSDSNCPSSDAISQRLLGLLAAGGPAAAEVVVRNETSSMRIQLSTPGEATRERSVPADGDCATRAEKAALIIASWLDAMPVGTLATPGVPPRVPTPAAQVDSSESDPLDDLDNPPFSIGTHTLLGAGCFAVVDGQGVGGGLALVLGMPNLLERFGWSVEASLGTPRQMSVGQGAARYWRPTLTLAVTAAVRSKNWEARPQAGAVLGVLSIDGTGFNSQNLSATTVNWGAAAGVTLARPWRRNEFWLRVEGVAWPQGRAVRSKQLPTGGDTSASFPNWELRSTAGISWGIL